MTSDLSAETFLCYREATFITSISLDNLKMRNRLGRVNFCKGFWDCYKGQGKNGQCHDGYDNERRREKNNGLQVHQAFLYISLPLLYDYDGKMTNFTFYGGRKLFVLFLNLNVVLRNMAQKEFSCI